MSLTYLGRARDPRAVPVLLDVLKNYHTSKARAEEARGGAASALGMIGDKSAIPALKEALKTDKKISSSIILALVDLGETTEAKTAIKEGSINNKFNFYLIERLLKKDKDEEIIDLLKTVSNNEKDKKVWVHIMSILAKIGKIDEKHKSKLENIAINSDDEYLRSSAICILRLIGDQKSISIIANALNDTDSRVRMIAVRELEQLSIKGNKQAISFLKEASSINKYDDVKAKAKESIKRINK